MVDGMTNVILAVEVQHAMHMGGKPLESEFQMRRNYKEHPRQDRIDYTAWSETSTAVLMRHSSHPPLAP